MRVNIFAQVFTPPPTTCKVNKCLLLISYMPFYTFSKPVLFWVLVLFYLKIRKGGEDMPKLTEKQKRFVEEYLIDLNATQAVIRAGYSTKRASEQGYQLLQKDTVKEAIDIAIAERANRTHISQDRVLQEIALIAFSNGSDFAKVVSKTEIDEDGNIVHDPITGEPKTFFDIELVPTEQLTREQQSAIACIKQGKFGIEVKPCDKLKALELLGKHLGLFKDEW